MSTTALNNLFLDAVKETAEPLLKGAAVLTPKISNKFDDEEVQALHGGRTNTVSVPVPEMPADADIGEFTRGTDVAKATRSATSFVEVEIDTVVTDDYPVYADERKWMYTDPENFTKLKILPRLETIIRRIERAGFAKHVLMKNVVGTAGDPVDSIADIDTMVIQADTQLMPPAERFYFTDPQAYSDISSIDTVVPAQSYGSRDPMVAGVLPEIRGVFPIKSLYLRDPLGNGGLHISGGWYDATTPVVKDGGDALAIGDKSMVVDGLAASGAAEVKLGDRFTLAADSTIYTVSATAASNSAGEATVAFIPGLVADPGDGAAVTILQSGATGKYVANLLISPSALLYGAMAVDDEPDENANKTTIEVPGIGKITFEIWSDKRANAKIFRYQIAYGWGIGQQDMGMVVLG